MMTNESHIQSLPIYHHEALVGYHFPGDGPPLVCLHGFGGSGLDFEALADALDGRIPLIALHLPGHAGLPHTKTSFATLVRSIASITPKPLGILGYSMGGRLALRLLVEGRISANRIYLIGTTPGLRTAEEKSARARFELELTKRLEQMSADDFQDWWQTVPIITTQACMPEPYRERMLNRRRQNDLRQLLDSLTTLGTTATPTMWQAMKTLQLRTDIIVGAQDEKYRRLGEQMVESLPNGYLHTITNAGHAPHLEAPNEIAALLTSLVFG